nr:ribonuclease H-like domain-containing protein [Tanacetum cinerariifolium]
IRDVLLMLEILLRKFFLKLNLSDHRSILTDLQETLKRRWRYLVLVESHIHNYMLIPNYQDIIYQDFRYSNELSNLGRFQSLLSQLETHSAGVSTEDANQKFLSGPQLDHDDLEQVDEFDLKKIDLKWQVAMISTRVKKFYKKTRRKLNFDAKEHVGFDKSKDQHKAMVTVDGEGVDWTRHAKDETEDYALMAYNSSNSGSDTEMSAKDKSGIGYGSQIHDGVLSYENEVFASVFDSRSSDVEDSPVNDRFVKVIGMHAVPPRMTENYMPPKSDFGIDESKFTYDPKQSSTSKSNAKTSNLDSCDSNSSVETLESIPKPVENEPKAISEPKVWSDAPIIEEYESDSDDEHVTIPSKELENLDNPHQTLKGKGIIDSECFRHMTGNKAYLVDYQDFNGGHVSFGVSTTCYVLNRVLVTKPQNKTPYELLTGKFAEKSDEGFLVGYSLSSKAFREILTWKITMLKNTIYCHYGLLILQLSRSKAKNGDENLNVNTDSKTNKESVDKEDQAFLEELERLKRQKKKAIDATETLRKTFAQSTEDFPLQGGVARTSSTKFVNTATTPLNTASTPTNQDDL